MSIFYKPGQIKIRPGIYKRYVNNGTVDSAGALNGVVALTIKSNWGELDKVHTLTSLAEAYDVFGDGGEDGTVGNIIQALNGGANTIKVVRLGTGGTKATSILKDTSPDQGVEAIEITAKCPGSRNHTFALRIVLGDIKQKEFIIYEGTKILEKFLFNVGDNEVTEFLEKTIRSNYYTFTLKTGYEGNGILSTVTNGTFTGGTDPEVTNLDYSNAFTLLERERWNTIAVDTDEQAIHTLLISFIKRAYNDGLLGIAVIADKTNLVFEERLSKAKSINSYLVAYIGNGFYDQNNNKIEGHIFGARMAGVIASVPSKQSITHYKFSDAKEPIEMLTNSQLEQCILNGVITLSMSSKGLVWLDSGVSTLVEPDEEDDEGWKKIKRTKIRFELFQRSDDTLESLVADVPNNTDGQSVVLQALQGVINKMIAEEKLLPGGTIYLDTEIPPAGDYAYFNISVDDPDDLEKLYLKYMFRFSANN